LAESGSALLLQRVLDLLTGLLQVGHRLIGLTFVSKIVIARGLAGNFFQLSLRVLLRVLDLVGLCHGGASLQIDE
jgi:hypothetical protein